MSLEIKTSPEVNTLNTSDCEMCTVIYSADPGELLHNQ